jgi:hypothetical protein
MKKTILILMLILMSFNVVLSASPSGHQWAVTKFFQTSNSDIARLCKNYEAEFRAGTIISDFAVLPRANSIVTRYIENGGKDYKFTHSWNFQQEVMNQARNDAERCFAYGIGLGHLVTDSVYHEVLIPEKISDSLVGVNYIVHPIIEASEEVAIIKHNSIEFEKSKNSLRIMLENPRYCEMMTKAIGNNIEFNCMEEVNRLNFYLGGDFYSGAYKGTERTNIVMYYIYKAGSSFGSFSSYQEADFWTTKASQGMDYYAKNWQERVKLSPDGFEKLNEASMKNNVRLTILIVIILILLIFVIRKRWIK